MQLIEVNIPSWRRCLARLLWLICSDPTTSRVLCRSCWFIIIINKESLEVWRWLRIVSFTFHLRWKRSNFLILRKFAWHLTLINLDPFHHRPSLFLSGALNRLYRLHSLGKVLITAIVDIEGISARFYLLEARSIIITELSTLGYDLIVVKLNISGWRTALAIGIESRSTPIACSSTHISRIVCCVIPYSLTLVSNHKPFLLTIISRTVVSTRTSSCC